ncbi:MAG: aldose 1-epimerase [Actinomycetaceae bacterium]|nr:aldose 1-epimerase [Actinomycetaceae bacterium]MDY6083115.1 aldose 1-epimerase [Actinomycetaceae bacterium]
MHISAAEFDGLPAFRISLANGATALIALHGATLISWEPSQGNQVIDGYTNATELLNHFDARSMVMAPWSGLIKDARYFYEGTEHVLEGICDQNGWGGLAGDVDFTRVDPDDSDEVLTLHGTIEPREGYPWMLDLDVMYGLELGTNGESRISATITVTNRAADDAPVSVGWHPYVKLPGTSGISNYSLTVPARSKVLTDSHAIPLPGDSALAGITQPARFDYIGTKQIDQAFTHLVPDSVGVVATVVSNPLSSARVTLLQEPTEAPFVHVFTGDVSGRPRTSIALEPCSAPSNAFNRGDYVPRLRLAPGEERSMTATLSFEA